MFRKREGVTFSFWLALGGFLNGPLKHVLKPKPDVEIRLMRRADKSLYWEISVRSKKILRLKSKGIWEWNRSDQSKELGILAAAMAEQQAEKYKDSKMDPDWVYNETVRIYREMRARNIKLYGMGDELPRSADKQIADRLARH